MEFGRGRLTSQANRKKVVTAIKEAVNSGARQFKACQLVGISERTYQRWKAQGENSKDGRPDAVRPLSANKLSLEEEKKILQVMNQKEHRSLSPNQVFHKLIDQHNQYIASVSSFYRVLRHYGQISHRGYAKAPAKKNITTHCATGPNQVWMWDITWLPGPAKGIYYYLYMIIDLFSRKIVGWEIWDHESSEKASLLVRKAVYSEKILLKDKPLILHSDNGSPMKGASLLTTLYNLGIVRSNSRPRVSNDNAYIESMFRTVKYMPSFPHTGFLDLESAGSWVDAFVKYYNNEHHHSSLKFLTPNQRHNGHSEGILAKRKEILEAARAEHPERWSGSVQDCTIEQRVWLNPAKEKNKEKAC